MLIRLIFAGIMTLSILNIPNTASAEEVELDQTRMQMEGLSESHRRAQQLSDEELEQMWETRDAQRQQHRQQRDLQREERRENCLMKEEL